MERPSSRYTQGSVSASCSLSSVTRVRSCRTVSRKYWWPLPEVKQNGVGSTLTTRRFSVTAASLPKAARTPLHDERRSVLAELLRRAVNVLAQGQLGPGDAHGEGREPGLPFRVAVLHQGLELVF